MSRLLAIKWGSPPTAGAWKALSVARVSLGIKDKIEPARAYQGSPGRILAIGAHPDWLCEYAFVFDTSNPEALRTALGWCFEMNDGAVTPSEAEQLSRWFGVEVAYVGDELLG